MNQLYFEEKLEIANKMRASERFAPVSEEEFSNYPVSEMIISIESTVGKSKIYLIKPDDNQDKERPLLIDFHGGGFIKGRLDRDKIFCYKLAKALDCVILDVDYKLAPEHPYPYAFKECDEIVQWAFNNSKELNIDEKRIGLLGHSAGGNLAVGAINLASENNGKIPKCIAIEYPPLDLLSDPEKKPRNERDLPASRAKLYNSFYCDEDEAKHYYVSPLFTPIEQLKEFPNTLVITAGEDSLADEAEEFALKLAKAGVKVTVKRFTNSVHGFTINRVDEHESAFELFVKFMKEELI